MPTIKTKFPKIGDVYRVVREDGLFSAYMVVEIHEGEVILGNGKRVFWADLNDTAKWKLIKEAK